MKAKTLVAFLSALTWHVAWSDQERTRLGQRQLVDTLSLVGNNGQPTNAYPLQKCQGDCDSDDECNGSLICFQRDGNERVPGCSDRTSATKGRDFCIDASDRKQPSLQAVGNNGTPASAFPLSNCQGDCDVDADCQDGLKCFQRDRGDTASVPGCLGSVDADTKIDFCYDPNDSSLPMEQPDTAQDRNNNSEPSSARPPVPGAFRFKKYWQEGFMWQEENFERKWCMQCAGSDCNDGDEIFIRHCSNENSWFVYKDMVDGTALLQVAGTDLCLEWVDARDLRVRRCDTSVVRQQFKALNGAFGASGKFEISTARKEGCLIQHHHPKDGEKVFRSDCETARSYDTSYWVQY